MIISARFLTKIGAAAYGALLMLVASPAGAVIPLSNTPLFLTVTMPPNITLTLDDSGSMSRAWVPEICPGTGDIRDCSVLDNRYAKSAAYNLLYYNPKVIYPKPKHADGTDWPTAFTAAHRNGFDTAFGSNDLRTRFRPTASLFLHPLGNDDRNDDDDGPSEEYMGHYSADIDCPNSGTKRCRIRDSAGTWHMGATSCDNDSDCTVSGNGTIPPRTPAYYYNFDKNLTNCNGTLTDNDCYALVVVSSTSGPGTVDLNGNKTVGDAGDKDERQNFANWYSFARTRNLATVTAASISFATLDNSTRIAWQGLNSCRGDSDSLETTNCQGWKKDTTNIRNRIGTYGVNNQKLDFYNWLVQLPTAGGTPLPAAMDRVGRYYQTTGGRSPYDNNPESTLDDSQHACRRNYHIMMTDGIWNDDIDDFDNADNTNTSLPAKVDLNPDVSEYFARAPYKDDYADTLADVAFHYWMTDLANLNNILAPVFNDRAGKDDTERFWNAKNNPAIWQHMVNFTIGLGLSGYLSHPDVKLTWDGSTYGGSYPKLAKSKADGGISWPNANDNDQNPANVADLWHAAINSRGQFFSADDPASLAASFQAALTAITGSNGSSAALSANSTSAQSGVTFVYQAKFNRDWSGTLLALPVSDTGKVGQAAWDAGELIPGWKERRIYTMNELQEGVEFLDCSGPTPKIGAVLAGLLNTSSSGTPDGLCQKRVDWIRGSILDEQRFTNGVLRNRPPSEVDVDRTKVMGDIINSDPAYVEKPSNAYDLLPDGTPGVGSYKDFASSIGSRAPMVYVGANDGMFHGIDAKTGVEQFAYIPRGVHETLARITDPSYAHRYYVDGGVTAGDAFVKDAWRTVAVGGLNAGGRSIYALDVTDPTAFNEKSVLWEFFDVANMGLSFSQPQIGVTESGHWVAIFGNGYNSPRGTARLYVVKLDDGTLLRDFEVGPIALTDNLNGLSTPLVHDSDNNGRIDTVYAGDLQGNLWKWDLSGKTYVDWKTDFSGAPLFTADVAGVRQPITSQPKATGHPDGGSIIVFGTGRYLAINDVNDKSRQTYYGIRDHKATGSYLRANLQVQTITMQKSEDGEQIRGVSAAVPDWSSKKGWYLDLVDPGPTLNGERVVSTSLIKLGRAIFVTVIPSTDPCVPGGKSWLMELDIVNGGTFPDTILDVNGDGKIDSKDDGNSDDGNDDNDQVATGMLLDNLGISKTPIWLSGAGELGYKMGTGTSGAVDGVGNKQPPPPPPPPECEGPPESCEPPPPVTPVQRRSWIQIR
jgi:type IV pilus assembly protein PilY1